MTNETFASVWDVIEDTPPEAENMKLRSALMMALEKQIHDHGWTPAEAARRLGVTQSRVSDLMRGKIDELGMDTLLNMAVAAGLHNDDPAWAQFKALLVERINAGLAGKVSSKSVSEIFNDELARLVAGITTDDLHPEINTCPDGGRERDKPK
ncbi:helix-turn-helix domain-containing protein [Salmonella enterica subsp. enterica]|nr:helix-turn-helix domain-containing protein [Salmonella enterica subsp. enterica serovar Brazos]EED4361514.1 helix-turn-helix domain-containing protein [Salmonella enterica subsp. enterica]EEF8198878.1 helix-turn-helix domain-containing protein [Salmonella enterica]EEM3546238.1 helix-turn-helix domain-containing protein [Salmonella enterica]EJQ3116366.1 XRE family transcriptional regulator [Salmonella enterica]